jgi:hypothetical protein
VEREVKVLTSSHSADNGGENKITVDQMIRFLRRILAMKTENAFNKLSKVGCKLYFSYCGRSFNYFYRFAQGSSPR